MYNIAICDDELRSYYNIESHFKELLSGSEVRFVYFESGDALISKLRMIEKIDLLILDIVMPGRDGYKTAEEFRKVFPSALLVFYSGEQNLKPQSFKVTPYRYIVKGALIADLMEDIEAIVEEMRRRSSAVEVIGKHYKSIRRFLPANIMYFENDQSGSVIHSVNETDDSKIITEKKLPELENLLKEWGFRIIHIKYLVNMNYVIGFDASGELLLEDGTRLSVSRSNLKAFREEFAKFLSEKY